MTSVTTAQAGVPSVPAPDGKAPQGGTSRLPPGADRAAPRSPPPRLCAPGSTVIWSQTHWPPELTRPSAAGSPTQALLSGPSKRRRTCRSSIDVHLSRAPRQPTPKRLALHPRAVRMTRRPPRKGDGLEHRRTRSGRRAMSAADPDTDGVPPRVRSGEIEPTVARTCVPGSADGQH
jgi:hypothetical protein